MKNLIIAFLIITIQQTFGQSWNGVPISGNLQNLKNNLSAKGFTFVKKEENVVSFKGEANGTQYELYAYLTPLTGIVAKFTLYMPLRISWYGLKNDYQYVKNILTQKYGVPEHYEYFVDPYYEGDGYELSAVKLEKCKYASFWLDIKSEPNTKIMLQISEYEQVKIIYQNNQNINIAEAENEKINKNVF